MATNEGCQRIGGMGGITVGAVEDYLYSMLPARGEVLTEIESEAARNKVADCRPGRGACAFSTGVDYSCEDGF